LTTPAVTLETISVAGLRVCGMRADGSAVCWTEATDPIVEEKPGPLKAIAAGLDGECIMHLDGTVACRGEYYDDGARPQPTGVFDSIAQECGIRPGGTVSCWGQYRR